MGANFQFLDFGTPLEKSISLTFSEQWLCHFSRRGFGGAFQQDDTVEKTTRLSRARGTAADIYIYIYIYMTVCKKNPYRGLVMNDKYSKRDQKSSCP